VHHEIHLKPEDFLATLPEAMDAMDHPSGDGINTYVVSKATKNAGITMALSGLGGDELFAGYDVFKRTMEMEQKSWLNAVPSFIRKAGAAYIRSSGKNAAADKKAQVLSLPKIDFAAFYPITRRVLAEEQVQSLLKKPITAPDKVAAISARVQQDLPGDDYTLSRVSVSEISTYMQNVLLRDADQMSMASALEIRVPFLDYELVEYVLQLRDEIKYPHSPKKLLVDAMGDLLPKEITDRKKMGFIFPWEHWMRNELKAFCTERLEWLCSHTELFEASGVRALWQRFLDGDQRVSWSRVWPLIVLSHWMQKNNVRG
jgi:asparagine synthase (glutamine-hydrolysing)